MKKLIKKIHNFLKKNQHYSHANRVVLELIQIYRMYGVFGLKVWMAERMIENSVIQVDVQTKKIKFLCPGVKSIRSSQIYFECEPDTCEWINNFKPKSVFYDIGGNLGGFSLLASSLGHEVFCFEPATVNLSCIQQNIYINPSISENISVMPIALNDRSKISQFYMHDIYAGVAKNSVDRPEWWGGGFDVKFKQSVLSMSLDDCAQVFSLPNPNYVKIDVDGNEELVLDGMNEILKSYSLLEIFVELPLSSVLTSRVIEKLGTYSFKVVGKVEIRNITNYHFSR